MTDAELEARVAALVDARLAERLAPLEATIADLARRVAAAPGRNSGDRVSLLVFSGEMDNLLAAFIIATGAAAMEQPVSMFFTFWGLNALRKQTSFANKSISHKMIAAMLPRGPADLPTSRMNTLGLGPMFFRSLMDQQNAVSLPVLIQQARDLGVKMVACETSMAVMGIQREELIDGVAFGGVVSYLEDANTASVTLFV